jgi:hypothetical protein
MVRAMAAATAAQTAKMTNSADRTAGAAVVCPDDRYRGRLRAVFLFAVPELTRNGPIKLNLRV